MEELEDWRRRLSYRAAVDAIERVEAGDWPQIERFWAKHLPDSRRFVGRDEARSWLAKQGKRSRSLIGGVEFHFGDEQGSILLTPSRPNALFDTIEKLALDRHGEDGWSLDSARAWMVCENVVPYVPAYEFTDEVLPEGDGITSHFVTLKYAIDTPPSRLKPLMAEVRKRAVESGRYRWPLIKPARPLNERTEQLVLFVAARNDGRTWAEVRDEWNLINPKKFRFASNASLSESARDGYLALMGEPLDWKSPSGRHKEATK